VLCISNVAKRGGYLVLLFARELKTPSHRVTTFAARPLVEEIPPRELIRNLLGLLPSFGLPPGACHLDARPLCRRPWVGRRPLF
jgi:hypothetical protein